MQYKIKGSSSGLNIYNHEDYFIFYSRFQFRLLKSNTITIYDYQHEAILQLKDFDLITSDYEIDSFNPKYFKEKPMLFGNHNIIELPCKNRISFERNLFSFRKFHLQYNDEIIGNGKFKLFSLGWNVTINFDTKDKHLIKYSLILLLIKFTISDTNN